MSQHRKLSKSDQGDDERMREKILRIMREDHSAWVLCQLDHDHDAHRLRGRACVPSTIRLRES